MGTCVPKKNSLKKPKVTVHLKGLIEFEKTSEPIPPYVIQFCGKQTKNDKQGFFSLKFETNDFPIQKLAILICKNSDALFEKKNTVKTFMPQPDTPYLYFEEINGCLKETTLPAQGINESCISILLDPSIVEKVVPWEEEIETIIKEPIIKLPKIILKSNLSREKLEESSLKSLNASLDHAHTHEHAIPLSFKHKTPRGGTTLITFPQ